MKNISLDGTFHAQFNEDIFQYFLLENQMEKCHFLKNSRYFHYVEKMSFFFESLTWLKELEIFQYRYCCRARRALSNYIKT